MAYNLITSIFLNVMKFLKNCNFFKNIFQVASINSRMKDQKASDSGVKDGFHLMITPI